MYIIIFVCVGPWLPSEDIKPRIIIVHELRSCVKVEVAVLGSPVPNKPCGFCGRNATLNCSISELRICVKVEVDVLGSPFLTDKPRGYCARKAPMNQVHGLSTVERLRSLD